MATDDPVEPDKFDAQTYRQQVALLDKDRQIAVKFHQRFLEAVRECYLRQEVPLPPYKFDRLDEEAVYGLLRLRYLERTSHLSLAELVHAILTSVAYQMQNRNLGIFCGPYAEKVISDYLEREYPNGENLETWRSDQRLGQLAQLKGINKEAGFAEETLVQDYQAHAKQMRRYFSHPPKGLGTKPYRGNPWR